MLETFAVLIGNILEKEHLLQGLKQAEIRQASERLQRALLQSVSHELKTPLAAVQVGIDAVAKEVVNRERSQTTLFEIQQAVRRLHRVINNLLDMTRIESGVIHPKLDWCDIEELIRAAIDLAADGISGNPVTIEADRSLPIVKVDQALLEQCLCNLLLNAASNSRPGAKIIIRARVAAGRLILSVLTRQRDSRSRICRVSLKPFTGARNLPRRNRARFRNCRRLRAGTWRKRSRGQSAPRGAEFAITIPIETLRADVLESFA